MHEGAGHPEGKGIGCFAGQYEKYEGLTVNFAEAVNSAGGVITDSSGKPNVNTPEAKAGVNALVDGFKSGFIPKEAITYREEPGRQAFQAGKLLFHRQWPYQYALANKTDGSSKVAGKFAVTALPGIGSAPGASSLGGHNVAISSFAKNKATAIDFISWFTSEANQRINLTKNSNAPTFTALYDDPAPGQAVPVPAGAQGLHRARGPAAQGGQVRRRDRAIEDAAYSALTGAKTTDAALAELQDKLTALTQ
ncbi:MAG: extracellular solute-binding protein [Kineosporiaceae bacterium]